MSDPNPAQPAPEGDADEPQMGLSLSELLGEVWSPASVRVAGDEDALALDGRHDPESGEPSPWNR